MGRKKKILFVFPDMIIGGATSAFVAFLRKLDYAKYDVDLLFLNNGEDRVNEIPREVNILPDAAKIDLLNPKVRVRKILNFVFTGKAFAALWETIKLRKQPFREYFQTATNQMLARIHSEMCPKLDGKYDLAIAYLELWPTIYTAEKVQAERKIAWVHVDYPDARLNPELDRKYYEKMDRIVCVSPECMENMQKCFPQLQERMTWAENYVDEQSVIEKAKLDRGLEESFRSYDGFRIVTVARLDSYTKGLDRIVRITKRLKDDGLSFRWYLIGGGSDEAGLRSSIAEMGISDMLYLLGAKDNPYPYMAKADLFVLASRNEGKPITVTEAQILQTSILVTEYPAARKQLKNDNCVVLNEEDGLYKALKQILSGAIEASKSVYCILDKNSSINKLDQMIM